MTHPNARENMKSREIIERDYYATNLAIIDQKTIAKRIDAEMK